jgi:hypothetical protein
MGFTLLTIALVGLSAPAGQEPPADPPKKKVEPPADDKLAPRAKDKDTEPKDAKDDKDAKEDPVAAAEKRAKEILARITKNLESAEERLKKQDAGDVTQQHQRDVVKDIDALMEQLKQQQQQQQQQQAGGGGGGGSTKGSTSGGGSSRQRSARSGRGQQPNGQAQGNKQQNKNEQLSKGGSQPKQGNQPKDAKNGNNGGMGGSSAIAADKLADLYKDIWGHLPEQDRQQMDAYQKEGYMAKYRELLKLYYATVAEKGQRTEKERRSRESDR